MQQEKPAQRDVIGGKVIIKPRAMLDDLVLLDNLTADYASNARKQLAAMMNGLTTKKLTSVDNSTAETKSMISANSTTVPSISRLTTEKPLIAWTRISEEGKNTVANFTQSVASDQYANLVTCLALAAIGSQLARY